MHSIAETEGKSRKKGVPQYAQNPFWKSTEMNIRGKRVTVASGAYLTDDGDRAEAAGIHVIERVERAQFVKLYTREMKAIFELKPTALKVVQYLLAEIQKTPNMDGVYLHWIGAKQYFSEQSLKVGRTAFQNALRELLEKRLIAESNQPPLFWINPRFFWNGDRYRFVRDYIVEG